MTITYSISVAQAVPRGRVVGVDLSDDMVRHARTTFGHRYPQLTFRQGDARTLDFTNAFSAIFSSATLHWIRDPAPVVAGIARALRSNGRLVAQFGGHGNTREVIAAFEEVTARPRWRAAYANFESTYGFYTAEQYAGWLSDAGLDVVEARLVPKSMVHADRDALVGWLRTAWHPYTSPIAQSERADLIDEVVDCYLSRSPPDANGAIHVALVRLQVQARKGTPPSK
jgi:trans-aconitate methyltransferase